MAAHVSGEEHHPSESGYIRVAIALFLFTTIEVIAFYVEPLRLLDLLAPILLLLSAIKFATVGGWYMHLKFDSKIFMVFFGVGLALAATVILLLMTLTSELDRPGKPFQTINTQPTLQAVQAEEQTKGFTPKYDLKSIGNVELGREFFVSRGCTGCHQAPGIQGGGQIGPNQAHFSERPTIAGGLLPNTPEAVEKWLKNPQAIKPGTLMPDLSLNEDQIRDLTAFLYSLP